MEEKRETVAEKKQRHAQQEKALRDGIKGNAPYRAMLAQKIVDEFLSTHNVSEHEADINRLLCCKENYKGCEHEFDKLLIVLQNTKFAEKSAAFKKKVKK